MGVWGMDGGLLMWPLLLWDDFWESGHFCHDCAEEKPHITRQQVYSAVWHLIITVFSLQVGPRTLETWVEKD